MGDEEAAVEGQEAQELQHTLTTTSAHSALDALRRAPSEAKLWSLRHALLSESFAGKLESRFAGKLENQCRDLLQDLRAILADRAYASMHAAREELSSALVVWEVALGSPGTGTGQDDVRQEDGETNEVCSICRLRTSKKAKQGYCQSSGSAACRQRAKEAREVCSICHLPISKKSQQGHCQSMGSLECRMRRYECSQDNVRQDDDGTECLICRRPMSAKAKLGHCQTTGSAACVKKKKPSPGMPACEHADVIRSPAEEMWAVPALRLAPTAQSQREPPCSILMFGPPGSGKSYSWRRLLTHLERQIGPSRAAKTAPFGVVAQHAGGSTLHSWAGLGDGKASAQEIADSLTPGQRRRWRTAQVLGIDDASPLDAATLDKTEEVARLATGRELFFGGLLLVLNFDLAQLPPVQGLPLQFSKCWKRLTDPGLSKLVHCQHNHRFDSVWKDLVGRTRLDQITQIDVQMMQGLLGKPLPARLRHAPRLTALRPTGASCIASEFVQARLDALGDVESHHYFDRYEPRTHNEWTGMGEPATEFKIGAKVLHTRNVRARGASQELASQELANGTMGIVIGFQQIGDISWPKCEWSPPGQGQQTFVSVVTPLPPFRTDDSPQDGSEGWQLPVMLAEALTIHKALGLTLPAGEVECEGIWDYAQFYEAISRFPGADYVRLLNFAPQHVKSPKASLKEMNRLEQLAASQGFDLDSALPPSSTACKETEPAVTEPEGAPLRPPQGGVTGFMEVVYAGERSGAQYYDPGCTASECASMCIRRMLQEQRKPLICPPIDGQALPRNDSTEKLGVQAECEAIRAVMAALAAQAGLATDKAAAIRALGAPVPLGAAILYLQKAGVHANLQLHVRDGRASNHCPSPSSLEPGSGSRMLLLYCEDRTHLALLIWPDGGSMAQFLSTSNGVLPDPALPTLDEAGAWSPYALMAANGNPQAGTPYGDLPVTVNTRWTDRGHPSGKTVLQSFRGTVLSLDTEEPTAHDFEDHPTLVCEGYLWPRPHAGSGERRITVTISVATRDALSSTLSREYAVSSSSSSTPGGEKFAVDLVAKETSTGSTSGLPTLPNLPDLPLAAHGGRLEYGYYRGSDCCLTLAANEDKVRSISFRGGVAGVPNRPFLRNGPGKMQWTEADVRTEADVVRELSGTWIGGSLVRPAPWREVTLTAAAGAAREGPSQEVVLLPQAQDCSLCYAVFSSKTRPRTHEQSIHSCGDATFGCQWGGRGATRKFDFKRRPERRPATSTVPVNSCGRCDDDDPILEDDDTGNRQETAHVKILGYDGTFVWAATRSHLNKTTLLSAGGSAAYCVVHFSCRDPSKSRCFSAR